VIALVYDSLLISRTCRTLPQNPGLTCCDESAAKVRKRVKLLADIRLTLVRQISLLTMGRQISRTMIA